MVIKLIKFYVSDEGIISSENMIDFCEVDTLPFDTKKTWNASFITTNTRRWLPFGDEFVDVFLSRNIDACPFDREIAAVSQWIDEKNLFHIMRGK